MLWPTRLPAGYDVDHILDASSLHQKDNCRVNLQKLLKPAHGHKTREESVRKRKAEELAEQEDAAAQQERMFASSAARKKFLERD